MSKFDRDEIENYTLGSPLWAGSYDRILVSGVNDDEFWSDVFEGKDGKGFKKRLDCPENRATLILKYTQANPNQSIIRSALNELLWKLILAANPDFIDPHAAPEEPEDARPRDSLGRVMSPKALQWRNWTDWVNNPETSMRQITELRRTNPAFQEFYSHYAAQERTSTPVGDAVENLNVRPTKKYVVPADVQKFAAEYRTLSVQQLKTLLSPGLNPQGPAAARDGAKVLLGERTYGLIFPPNRFPASAWRPFPFHIPFA
jgi:hypothetical protein